MLPQSLRYGDICKKKRILTIEDDIRNLKILNEILIPDYEVEMVYVVDYVTLYNLKNDFAGSIEVKVVHALERPEIILNKTLKIISAYRPHLVLLDVMMPGTSGYDLCAEIRNCPDLKSTKIAFVSTLAMLHQIAEGYRVGADDYLTKPFDIDTFLGRVEKLLTEDGKEDTRKTKKGKP